MTFPPLISSLLQQTLGFFLLFKTEARTNKLNLRYPLQREWNSRLKEKTFVAGYFETGLRLVAALAIGDQIRQATRIIDRRRHATRDIFEFQRE